MATSPFSPHVLPQTLARKLSPPSPCLPTSLQTLDVLQQDLRGRIVPAKISNRTFEHMEIKFLVLELPLPEVRLANALAAENAKRELVISQYRAWYENEVKARGQRATEEVEGSSLPQEQAPLPPPPPQYDVSQRWVVPEHPIIKGATQDYFIIPDFETLVKIHKPTNVYRVYPRKSGKVAAYCTMKEVCSMGRGWTGLEACTHATPLGSDASSQKALFHSFTMSERVDPHLYRLVVKQDMADASRQWSESLEARALNFSVTPGTPIGWDGMFLSQNDAGFVLAGQTLNEKAVQNALGMTAFLKHVIPQAKKFTSLNEDFANMWMTVYKRRRLHYFISGDRPPTRDALGFAKQKGVHFFARYGPYYRYCY